MDMAEGEHHLPVLPCPVPSSVMAGACQTAQLCHRFVCHVEKLLSEATKDKWYKNMPCGMEGGASGAVKHSEMSLHSHAEVWGVRARPKPYGTSMY